MLACLDGRRGPALRSPSQKSSQLHHTTTQNTGLLSSLDITYGSPMFGDKQGGIAGSVGARVAEPPKSIAFGTCYTATHEWK